MKNFFNSFLLFFSKDEPTFTGAILPTKQQLAEMPKFDEIVAMATPVIWKPLDITKIPKYPVYSQNGSSSCVAMSVCLIASILYYMRTSISVMFSASWIYQQRSNRPSGGMIGTEAFKIATAGLLPEVLMSSQNLTEYGIDSVAVYPWYKTVAGTFSLEDSLVALPIKDIETVASVMQVTGKPINVWYEFTRAEWTSIPFVNQSSSNFLRHSVVAIDYGMYEGAKAIAIQESWGVGATQFGVVRIVKQDFHNSRNLFAAYPIRFRFDSSNATKPHFDGSIISLQKCLQSLGYFPLNVDTIERWGPVTTKSCLAFQKANGLSQTGVFDDSTRALLTKMFP